MNRDYLDCALWSSTDDDGEPLDGGGYEFAPGVAEALSVECDAWLTSMADAIADGGGGYAQAAHDLWLTRNGHGAGFWDGDWSEPAAGVLTAAAQDAGERNLYIGDDGFIYCSELPQGDA